MKIGALRFGLDNRGKPYVTWHWAWSLTWSWGINLQRGPAGRLGLYHLHNGPGTSRFVGLNTPLFSISYQSQATMPRHAA